MQNILIYLLFISLVIFNPFYIFGVEGENITPEFLLKQIELTRGPSSSFSCITDITSIEKNVITEQIKMKFFYNHSPRKINRGLGVFISPENQRGRKVLLIGTDSWYYIPGSKKPLKISPAQKLTGNASISDVLSVNYMNDYAPKIIGEEKIDNSKVYKLELTAKTRFVTYYRIIMYIQANGFTPQKAEYFSKSNKLMKTCFFKVYNKINNRNVCIEAVIKDALFNDRITTITYSKFKLESIPDSYFNKDMLKELNL